MTDQELFNTVATHLLTQNQRAVGDDGRCQWKTKDGLKCAAGCLILDEFYDPAFEGCGGMISNTRAKEALVDSGVNITQFVLVTELQLLHDNTPDTSLWPQGLKEIAEKRGL